jgi:polysaccharide pyruvyl transferase WcaK-like protein
MKKVIFLHETKTVNTGDLKCQPKLYYDVPNSDVGDIRLFKNFDDYDVVVVGGGGLIDLDYFDDSLEYISRLEDKKKIIWGAGQNSYRYTYPEYVADYDLIGLRDSVFKNLKMNRFLYVPCVSCKSDLFDDVTITNLMNKLVEKNTHIINFETAKNSDPMDEVIEKIARAKVIVTNTYHGTYWASLLGKTVYTVETTTKTKLLDLPLNIRFINYDTVINPNFDQKKNSYDFTYLNDCRKRNDDFYKKVLRLIDTE